MAFILGKISFLMALRQHTPYFRGDTQRLLEHLKNEIAIFGTKAVPAQSCQGQGVRSVIGQIEPALDRQRFVACIGQACLGRVQQPIELGLAARLQL
jgi:hypothetical protein